MSSDTSGSESESDWSESCCSDDEDPEEWHEEVDDLLKDMANDEPPPELIQHITSVVHLLFVILASNLQDTWS